MGAVLYILLVFMNVFGRVLVCVWLVYLKLLLLACETETSESESLHEPVCICRCEHIHAFSCGSFYVPLYKFSLIDSFTVDH